jgi:hypothetical protein
MALTKIGKEGITGISNSSNANAITIDSGENVTLSGTLGVTGDITGTLATAAQTNITSVGTLTSVTVNGTGTSNFTSTATSPVQINGTSIPTLTIRNSTTPVSLQMRATTSEGLVRTALNHPLVLGVNQSEKARIDTSGNLLVGTTNSVPGAGNTTVGASIYNDGRIFLSKSANTVASFNRNTSDGSIAEFRKDGTTVGSIGNNGTELFIGTPSGSGGYIRLQSLGIVPATSTGTNSDGTMQLGTASGRFSDLYLSSGVNIKGSSPKITLEHSNENGTAQIYTTAQSAIILDADPDNTDNGTPIQFKIDGSEVGRFDDGGNLLVGTTNSLAGINNTDEGISLRTSTGSASSIVVSRNTGISGYFNRNSSGDILSFRKEGSAVGSIGTAGGGAFYISDSTYGGVGFSTIGAGDINPCNTTGGARDNAMDLGQPTARFKDLYLSGGAYLGGTGSANRLDDYEEGTWTPTMGGTTTYYARTGEYTKVGNMVFVRGQVSINAIGTGSTSEIGGLPFTSKTTANGNPPGVLGISYYSGLAIAVNYISGYVTSADTNIQISANAGNNTTVQYNTGNFFGNGTRLDFTMVYQVA